MGEKVVLQGVSGSARPSTLHALLGPSGAGKSTLLDVLAGRKRVGRLSGTVMLGGAPASPRAMAAFAAYVPQVRPLCCTSSICVTNHTQLLCRVFLMPAAQEDNFSPVLTALETLRFHAAMRPADVAVGNTRTDRDSCAHTVMRVLGLSHCTHTMVSAHDHHTEPAH